MLKMVISGQWELLVQGILHHLPFGCSVTDGIECIPGSATYFMSTGVSLCMCIHHYTQDPSMTRNQAF